MYPDADHDNDVIDVGDLEFHGEFIPAIHPVAGRRVE